MLGKLLKYDIKGVARYMLPLYVLLLVSTCGMKLTLELSDNTIVNTFRVLFIIAYVISLIAIATGSLIVLILHFYKNLMTDQGYLSFTLPVTPTAHLTSKLINGLLWFVLTLAAVILSVLLLVSGHVGLSDWKIILSTFSEMIDELHAMGFHNVQMLFYVILWPLIGVLGGQIVIYFSICAGQLFSNHRIIGAFVVYFCWYVINQIVSVVLLLLNNRLFSAGLTDDMTAFGNVFGNLLNGSLLWAVIGYVVLFFATRWLMTKKLNLE